MNEDLEREKNTFLMFHHCSRGISSAREIAIGLIADLNTRVQVNEALIKLEDETRARAARAAYEIAKHVCR